MEEKKTTLSRTADALAELNNLVLALENTTEITQKSLAQRREADSFALKEKEEKIAALKESSEKALDGVAAVIDKLNTILEKDGSGNNNN